MALLKKSKSKVLSTPMTDHLYYISNKYYFSFERWRSVVFPKNIYLYLYLISAFIFVYCSYGFFEGKGDGLSKFIPLILSEFVFLYASNKISEVKSRVTLELINLERNSDYVDINVAKRDAIRLLLNIRNFEFIEKAKEIDDFINIRYRSNKIIPLSFERFYELIYNADAKGRILTLFIVLVSITLGLTANVSERSDQVFELLTHKDIGFLYVGFLICFGGGLLLLATVYELLPMMFSPIFTRLDGHRSKRKLAVNYLLKDMVRLHKPHVIISVKGSNGRS